MATLCDAQITHTHTPTPLLIKIIFSLCSGFLVIWKQNMLAVDGNEEKYVLVGIAVSSFSLTK